MIESEPTAMRPPPMNWGAFLDQVVRDYNTEPALGLYHGLQKEAVQNSYGAKDRAIQNALVVPLPFAKVAQRTSADNC